MKWKNTWKNSLRGKRDHAIDNSSPSRKFLELISNPKLPRQESSTISQLRITHIPLNSYLHRFKRVDSPRCPACGEEQETIEHFLLHCPAYAHQWWALKKTLKAKPDIRIKTLLGSNKATLALKNYIITTHRFHTSQDKR